METPARTSSVAMMMSDTDRSKQSRQPGKKKKFRELQLHVLLYCSTDIIIMGSLLHAGRPMSVQVLDPQQQQASPVKQRVGTRAR